jgi:sigma-E factor negative regulatory protein RseA
MNPLPDDPQERCRVLSALADGQTDAAAAGCAMWAADPAARATWHAYHLIGDVMRSEDLAHPPARDERFLAAFGERLAREPVVLAPMPASPATAAAPTRVRPRHRWLAPAAVAAGFAAVAGMLVITRVAAPDPDASGPTLALRSPVGTPVGAGVLPVGGGLAAASPAAVAPHDLKMIRDARLDSYLRAHREGLSGASVAVPGGALRSVETIVPPQR